MSDRPVMHAVWLLTGFSGRIPRMQFWIGFVVVIAVSRLVVEALHWSGLPPLPYELDIHLASAIFGAPIGVKRLHDRNMSGWFHLVWLIPVLGQLWWLIELGFCRSAPGLNKYGPDPNEQPVPT